MYTQLYMSLMAELDTEKRLRQNNLLVVHVLLYCLLHASSFQTELGSTHENS